MADYEEILDTQIEPDAPLTAVLAAQWRDNWIAGAEGAPGAPRFAFRARMISNSSGAVSYLGGYQGCHLVGYVSVVGTGIDIEFSNNGTTFPASFGITVTGGYDIRVDFATGAWFYTSVTGMTTGSGTMGSMPSNPTHIRITRRTVDDAATFNLMVNGGASTS